VDFAMIGDISKVRLGSNYSCYGPSSWSDYFCIFEMPCSIICDASTAQRSQYSIGLSAKPEYKSACGLDYWKLV
jgi:hypothetical protein